MAAKIAFAIDGGTGGALELGEDAVLIAGLAGVTGDMHVGNRHAAGAVRVHFGHHGNVSEDAAVRGRRSTHSRAPCIREPFAARAGPRVALWRR